MAKEDLREQIINLEKRASDFSKTDDERLDDLMALIDAGEIEARNAGWNAGSDNAFRAVITYAYKDRLERLIDPDNLATACRNMMEAELKQRKGQDE